MSLLLPAAERHLQAHPGLPQAPADQVQVGHWGGECLSRGQGCPRALLMRKRMGKGVKSVSWEGAGSASPSQREPSEELHLPGAMGSAGRLGTAPHGWSLQGICRGSDMCRAVIHPELCLPRSVTHSDLFFILFYFPSGYSPILGKGKWSSLRCFSLFMCRSVGGGAPCKPANPSSCCVR